MDFNLGFYILCAKKKIQKAYCSMFDESKPCLILHLHCFMGSTMQSQYKSVGFICFVPGNLQYILTRSSAALFHSRSRP